MRNLLPPSFLLGLPTHQKHPSGHTEPKRQCSEERLACNAVLLPSWRMRRDLWTKTVSFFVFLALCGAPSLEQVLKINKY